MFGFPSKVRYLYHDWPRTGSGWPPARTIDRDLDIAINQFAPASQSVKDRLIHTAIGVVDYMPAGPNVVERPDPLGPAADIGVCRSCHTVDNSLVPGISCPTCLATDTSSPPYKVVELQNHVGPYLVRATKDFDGTFEWSPRAGRPKVSIRSGSSPQCLNFEVWSGSERVYTINDNGGKVPLRKDQKFRELGNGSGPTGH